MENKFKDSQGREWSLDINVRSYMAIKKELNIDIANIFDDDNNWLENMMTLDDLGLLLEIIGHCLGDQLEKKEVSEDDFYGSLGGESLQNAASALCQAIVNFIPAHKREPLQQLMKSSQENLAEMSSLLVQRTQEIQKKTSTDMKKYLEESDSNSKED